MESFFWVGDVLDNFLFKGLNTTSLSGLLGICAALTSLGFIYEVLIVIKQFLLNRFLNSRKALFARRKSHDSNDDNHHGPSSSSSSRGFLSRMGNRSSGGGGDGVGEPAPRSLLQESDRHEEDEQNNLGSSTARTGGGGGLGFVDLTLASLLHTVYVFLGLTLMNAVMTFNLWVMLSICFGMGIGYFCFGNNRKGEHLLNPFSLGTETTSLNEEDHPPRPGTLEDGGGGDRMDRVTVSVVQGPVVRSVHKRHPGGGDAEESSRLIVGAEVHTPANISTSNTST